jgi:hypothetical protein
VNSLLEHRRHIEKQQRSTQHARKCTSLPVLSNQAAAQKVAAVSPALGRGGVTSTGFEARLERVKLMKESTHLDKMMRKMASMRSDPSPQGVKLLDSLVQEATDSGQEVNAKMKRKNGFTKAVKISSGPEEDAGSGEPGSDPAKKAGKERSEQWKRSAHRKTMSKACARRWRLLRGIGKFIMLFVHDKERHAKIGCVKQLLVQMGEATRMKYRLFALNSKIQTICRACKTYSQVRNRRIEELHRTWQQIEDHHLLHHFELSARKIVGEVSEQRSGSKDFSPHSSATSFHGHHSHHQDHHGHHSSGHHSGHHSSDRHHLARRPSGTLDHGAHHHHEHHHDPKHLARQNSIIVQRMIDSAEWQKLRIPVKERAAVLQQFYMAQLHNHMYRMSHLRQFNSYAQHHVQFAHDVGEVVHSPHGTSADFSQRRNSMQPMSQRVAFWHLTEENVLDLIAVAANEMRNVNPFVGHPVNLGNEQHVSSKLWQRSPQEGRLLMADHHAKEKQGATAAAAEKSAAAADAAAPASGRADGELAMVPLQKLAPGQADLDELMRRFSPRLWGENPGLILSSPPASASESRLGLLSRESAFRASTPVGGPSDVFI